jgi:predicted NAD/FAD-binding protein
MMRARETSPTVGELLDRLPLTATFRDEFLFPYLLAGWCVEPEEFREFSAYNVLRYSFANLSWRGRIPLREVVGGTRSYVSALLRDIPRATMKASCAIDRVERTESGWRVHEAGGAAHAFDHVIVTVNARDARTLLRDVPGAEGIREQLGRIDYFRTTIAVHGDRRLMPADERDWSIVNVRHDGRHAQTTVWKPWRSRSTVLRSWITYDERPPEPAYQITQFDHPKVNRAYFDVQRALAARPDGDSPFLAGMHTHDIDSHESALVSALHAVARLDPDAPRLAALR